jgi:hypothetical protein
MAAFFASLVSFEAFVEGFRVLDRFARNRITR